MSSELILEKRRNSQIKSKTEAETASLRKFD